MSMRGASTLLAAGATLALLAGCGSSSKSSTNAAATGSATVSGSSSTGGAYGAAPAATTAAAAAPVTVISKSSKLGTILAAGPKRLTVYMFAADKPGSPACSGACASAWPPVTAGSASASGAAQSGMLGTIRRADGTTQVTYAGHPLYYYARDGDAGDAYGQGITAFGAEWYVLAPSGSVVTAH